MASLNRGTESIITYRCRDIGYGIERGRVRGYWTGAKDTWGKLTIKAPKSGRTLYLFPDEIRRVREFGPEEVAAN